jgi:hypothetical protein
MRNSRNLHARVVLSVNVLCAHRLHVLLCCAYMFYLLTAWAHSCIWGVHAFKT